MSTTKGTEQRKAKRAAGQAKKAASPQRQRKQAAAEERAKAEPKG
jgi:hypothetical protein